jgi:hypothetical protein
MTRARVTPRGREEKWRVFATSTREKRGRAFLGEVGREVGIPLCARVSAHAYVHVFRAFFEPEGKRENVRSIAGRSLARRDVLV